MESVCSVCHRPISGGELLFTGKGEPVCPGCDAKIGLEQADVRAAGNITSSAVTSLLLSLVSFVINPFFILTILSISAGVYALKSFSPSNDRFAKHVASNRGLLMACAIAGLVLSGIRVLLVVLAISLCAIR